METCYSLPNVNPTSVKISVVNGPTSAKLCVRDGFHSSETWCTSKNSKPSFNAVWNAWSQKNGNVTSMKETTADTWQQISTNTHCRGSKGRMPGPHFCSCPIYSEQSPVCAWTGDCSPTPMLLSTLDSKKSRWIQTNKKVLSIQFSWLTKVCVDYIRCYNHLPNGK